MQQVDEIAEIIQNNMLPLKEKYSVLNYMDMLSKQYKMLIELNKVFDYIIRSYDTYSKATFYGLLEYEAKIS